MASQSMPSKKQPTHFLCLKITNPDIIEATRKLQDDLFEIEPGYKCSFNPLEQLHLTLVCLGLDSEEQVQRACSVLQEIQPELQKFNPQTLKLDINDTDTFGKDVLYGSVKKDEDYGRFCEFVKCLRAHFKEEHMLRGFESKVFHMTVMQFKDEEKEKYSLGFKAHRAYGGKYFGQQPGVRFTYIFFHDDLFLLK